MSAEELQDAIRFAQNDIKSTLELLTQRLPKGFVVTGCSVDCDTDRTFGGDVHCRFDVRIGVEVQG
jgi:hypothetical protein